MTNKNREPKNNISRVELLKLTPEQALDLKLDFALNKEGIVAIAHGSDDKFIDAIKIEADVEQYDNDPYGHYHTELLQGAKKRFGLIKSNSEEVWQV